MGLYTFGAAHGAEDGYGDAATEALVCEAPTGSVDNADDCNDDDAAIHPEAQEICDALDVDEDCDALSDDADPSVDRSTMDTWYADADMDGFGNPEVNKLACDLPAGFVADNTDCDDDDADANPELGCPRWDGLWDGELVLDLTVPDLGLSDTCSGKGSLEIEEGVRPELDVAGGTPWTCTGTTSGGDATISGNFIDEDTVDATLTIDGEDFGMTIELTEPGDLAASGTERKTVGGVLVILTHKLTATKR